MRRRFVPGVGVDGELLGVSLVDEVDARVRFGCVRLTVDEDPDPVEFASFLSFVSCNCLAGVELRVRVISTSFMTVNEFDPVEAAVVTTFVIVCVLTGVSDLLPVSLFVSDSSSTSSVLSTFSLWCK